MRIVRYLNQDNQVRYGRLDDDGVRDVRGDLFGTWEVGDTFVPNEQVRQVLYPVDPPNIYALGLNYRAHADEGGNPYPKEPIIFLKATTSLTHPGDPIVLPRSAPDEVDYEGELALIIGKTARRVSEQEAIDYLLGYTAANDVSARDCQLKRDKQWARGKSFDTFCPLGPAIQTEGNPDNVRLALRLNGTVMQDTSTSDLIFSCRQLISFLSHQFTLLPGTVILTGTPGGIGRVRTPSIYLRPGDSVEVTVEGVGSLVNPVAADET